MSNNYYEKELKGERNTALSIVSCIEADFQRHITSSHKDAPKNGLRYALNMLTTFHSIYRLAKENAHYDIFVDIYVRILAPHLVPEASPEHFKRLLPGLRHLYLTLASFKSNAETEQLYKCIVEQQTKWCDADDFKYLLDIHGTQIIWHLQNAAPETHKIDTCIAKLADLLKFAGTQCQKSELNALDLTNAFMGCLKLNIARGCALLSTNLNKGQRETLFGAYFELLHIVSVKPLTTNVTTEAAFQAQLKATYNLLNMDVSNNLEQQLALKHLQICLSISYLKEQQNIADCVRLLYNLFKLSYVQLIAHNFKEHYQRACEYFIKLIKKADKVLLKEAWFQDLLLVVYQLQISMHPATSKNFYIFWEQLDDTLLETHFYFLNKLLKTLPYTQSSSLFSQHAQLLLAGHCLEIYSFMLNKFKFCNEEPFTSTMLTINECLKNIMECVKCNINKMDNSVVVQYEIQKFNRVFINLMAAAKNPSQARFFIELTQYMRDLKSRLPAADWQLLVRRLYQLGAKTQHAETAAELHCCYIAELIASKSVQTVPLSLHNQIHFFYNGICSELIRQGNCLVEIYMQSKSVFKPPLQKHQIRLLHWLEAQYIFNNYKHATHAELFINFAMRSQSKYDFLMAVAAGKLIERQCIKSKVQNIYEQLKHEMKLNENNDGSNLKRMQELSLAHAAFLLWLECNEKQITNLKTKDFVEDNLTQLMQEKALSNLNVKNEKEMIEMALDALRAFKTFYDKADIEAIPVNEGGFIDWQIILDNLISLATYFQISGYIDYAIEAWLLQYRIARVIGDTQNCVRALTFFCEYNHFFDGANYECLNILEEITLMSPELINILVKLPQMLRRHQNLALICLCQIAYFYATQQRLEDARLYLTYVQTAHAKLERNSQYDIVRFTVDVVQFRILWKFNIDEAGVECNENSLLAAVDLILKRLEDYVNISSIDVTLFSLLIMNAVSDFADFIANRLTENILSSFFACCLKLSVDFGAAILTAKMLSKWATINLQMEYLQKAEIKFLLIESILGLRNPDKVAAFLKPIEKSETAETQSNLLQVDTAGLDYVRKVAVISPKVSLKDKKQSISPMAFDLKLNKFLELHKNKEIVQRSVSDTDSKESLLLWTRFVLGTLRARFNFLAKNNNELVHFYESCKSWLEKLQNSFHFKLFYAEILRSMGNYANFLRSSKKFDEAIELLEIYLKKFDNIALAANVDPACHLHLKLQLEDTKLEQLQIKNRNLPKRKKPELVTHLKTVPTTPLNKTTRYAQLPMTSHKKSTKTTTAFTIYSDRKSPRKAAEKHFLLPNSSTRKDLKFNDTEAQQMGQANDEIVLSSDSENEMERLKRSKKLVAAKFIFTEAIDLDDLTKPTTKKETMKTQLKDTKVSKTKKITKLQEDQLLIESSMKHLTIEPQKSANSESEELSPELSSAGVLSNEADIFKTPLSSYTTSKTAKSKSIQKRKNTKQSESLSKGSTTSSSGNSSDTCSTNSNEEQIIDVKAGLRRLRTRQIAVIDDSKPTTTSVASAKRRPR